jgi:hypothetical protein
LSWRGLKVWFIPLKEFMVYSIEGVSKVAVDFYKDLFGFESERDTDFENDFLCCQITEKEIKQAVYSLMLGPPPLNFFMFYQLLWSSVLRKVSLM